MHSAARLTPIGPLGLHTALSGLIVPAEGRSRTNNVQAAGAPHTAHRFLGTVRTAPLLAPLEPLMTTTAPHTAERFPAHLYATEEDYLAAYFASPDDAPMEDTPAALDECKRRSDLYWSPDACRGRRMVRAVAIRNEFGE